MTRNLIDFIIENKKSVTSDVYREKTVAPIGAL